MIVTTEVIDSKKSRLNIDFNDEGIDLSGTMLIAGDESAARAYESFKEKKLRRNNAELFPVPEMPEMEGETI